jgi:hypothetical protein
MNTEDIKKMKNSDIKKEIIRLRIKNRYYDKHSVMEKIINEILFEQFDNSPHTKKNLPKNRN